MTDMRNNKKLRDEIESLRQQLSNRDAEIAELKAELETERCLSFRNQIADLESSVASRDAEIAELKLRLEWNEDGCDGIACRNETIQMIEQDRHSLEQQLAEREKQIVKLLDTLNQYHKLTCHDGWYADLVNEALAKVRKP